MVLSYLGAAIGRELEADFHRRALEAGLTEEEAEGAYNKNMAKIGWTPKPADIAAKYDRKWLVSDFEAGDVVLHDPFTVSLMNLMTEVFQMVINSNPQSILLIPNTDRFMHPRLILIPIQS